MKIATTTYDFKGYTDATDYPAILPLFQGTGFRSIDINFSSADRPGSPLREGGWERLAENTTQCAANLGLSLVQAHASDSVFDQGAERERTLEVIGREFRACAMMGIPQMVVHCVYRPGNTWREQREANRRLFASLLPVLEETGVNLLIENSCRQNCGGMYYYTSAEFMLTTLRDLGNHPLVHTLWDVGHAHLQGVDQYKEITELGRELYGVHIHDNMGITDVHAAPYAGTLGYDAVLKGLVDSGYTGYFTLEAYSIPTPAEFLGREGYRLDGAQYDRICSLPLPLKLRSEKLMHDTARYMLEQYGCYDE